MIVLRNDCADKVLQAQTAMDEMTANMKVRLYLSATSLVLVVQSIAEGDCRKTGLHREEMYVRSIILHLSSHLSRIRASGSLSARIWKS